LPSSFRPSTGRAAELFCKSTDLQHALDAFGGRQTQILTEEREIDAVALGSLYLAAGARVTQALFGARELLGCQVVPRSIASC